jgi:microcystin-dependent protein|tara:strand:+ start:50 stop:676 length:627 start_codon:yes stop_codon:yes gene_type:complete
MANLQDITNRSEVGTIKPWGKATAPSGYLLCDGSAVSRSTYADLFAVISTTYGAGDSSTTFNVPDLQGKFPQGKSGTTNLATTGGANTVTVAVTNNQAATNATNQAVTVTGSIDNTSLTEAQLGSHDHVIRLYNGLGDPGQGAARGQSLNPVSSGSTTNAGSGTGHNHSHTLSGTLTGNITTTLTGAVTASGTNAFSPFVIVQYIIKH